MVRLVPIFPLRLDNPNIKELLEKSDDDGEPLEKYWWKRRRFWKRPYFCTKFDPLNDFLKTTSSYDFKADEFRNMRAFEFF